MESANLRHVQHQPPSVDTSLSTPPCYGIDGSTHSWSPQFSLNAGNLKNQILQEAASRSRDSSQKNETGVMSMIPDAGYKQYHPWASDDAESCLSSTTQSTHDLDLQFSNKKEEMCNSVAFPKFTEMLNIGWSSREHDHLKGVSEKLFLDTLSSGDMYSTAGGFGAPNRGKFSQIHPTINISNLNHSSQPPPVSTSSSINMNMQYLHLLRSPTLCGDDSSLSLHMQNHIHRSSNNSSNPSNFTSGVAETKRSNALMESKPYQPQTASKKIRPESRSSCPPLKVRKEKLGDRIAALQQLVAPFGKTDTASVLMEAIGYIKFLQNQVETLSVPYMKSSRNQNNRVMQGGSGKDGAGEIPKRDLRSRGLCLVPLSCMSYITGDHAPTAMWNQPNFGGPT